MMSENIDENIPDGNDADVLETTINEADTSISSILDTQESELSLDDESPVLPVISNNEPIKNINIEPAIIATVANMTDETETVNQPSESTPDIVPKQVKSRELKSLLDAVKEANLDTNIVHKRKSDHGHTLNVTKTPLKRRNSESSNDSQSSSQSAGKRSTRSQNPEFVQKHKKFLKSVTRATTEDSEIENVFENNDEDEDWFEANKQNSLLSGRKTPIIRPKTPTNKLVPQMNSKTPVKTPKRKNSTIDNTDGVSVDDTKKSKKTPSPGNLIMKEGKDKFCWRCHRDSVNIQCETCPRSYHIKCLKIQIANPEHWPCPECITIIKAESTKTRSPALKDMTQEYLCELLKYAVKRLFECEGSDPFKHPVDINSFPDYRTYVIQPMDLTTLRDNIHNNVYGSPLAFLADAKWILHNSIIFNSYQSKLTTSAKAIIKICKQEMSELETCAECYLNANVKKNTWFVEVCSKPHILLWAKLKGFPYWPAKGMKTDGNNVHVKFFGAHDRAWVPVKECFLYSRKDPNTTNKQKRSNIAECVKEVDIHIEKLKRRFGEFRHAPYRIPYNPAEENEQLLIMLPKFDINRSPSKLDLTVRPIKKRQKSTDSSIISDTSPTKEEIPLKKPKRLMSVESSPSKSSVNSDEKSKPDENNSDYDKFIEGYGTEDEDLGNELNVELRSKLAGDYVTDNSDNESLPRSDSLRKEISEDDVDRSSVSSTEMSVLRGKCRTRGGYHNVSGKIKIISGRKSVDNEMKKRSRENSPETPSKSTKIENDERITSDDKINKSDATSAELSARKSLDNTKNNEKGSDESKVMKISDEELSNTNIELKVSPQIRIESMADKIIKKINMTHVDNGKVETMKKQIFNKLESTSKTVTSKSKVEETKQVVEAQKVIKADVKKVEINSINATEKEKVLNEENKIEKSTLNETQKAAADSQSKISSDTSEDEFLCLKQVKTSYSAADNNLNKKTDTNTHNKTVTNEKIEEKPTETKAKSEEDQIVTTNSKKLHENAPVLKKILTKKKLVNTADYFSSDSSSEYDTSETESISSTPKQNTKGNFKVVNVSDIMSGKVNSDIIVNKTTPKPEKNKQIQKLTEKENAQLNSIHDSFDIKTEPLSDEEPSTSINKKQKEKPQYDVTLSVIDKNKNGDKPPFKIVDNLTKIIDSVAKNTIPPTTKESNVNFISPKQKARKSFPNVLNKSNTQTFQIRKITQEKKEYQNNNLKNIPPRITIQSIPKSIVNTMSKDNTVYITSNQNSVVLPPNQPISIASSIGNPLFAMVQHSNFNNTGVLIQNAVQSIASTTVSSSAPSISTPSIPTLVTTSSAVSIVNTAVTTANVDSVSSTQNTPSIDIFAEDVSKTVGDLLCKPPPKLKPRPPGPLSTFFEEGNPSNIGNVTKTLNSVSHRLTDYFCGLIKETLSDISNVGSPEAKIKSLELEIENLKHKHNEEMLEFRKNISTILRDIKKSIQEEKNKIIDETRTKCEAERLRSVEEAKSKQWCAFCLKEAQFYCCWNTSYCDYPCQQKHWATHMKTCSQNSVRSNPTTNGTNTNKQNSPAIFKTLPKHYTPTTKVVKATRMIQVKPALGQKSPVFIQRPVQIQGSGIQGQSTLTLVESTPGNFEIVGNHGPISLDGKLIPANIGKVKTTTVTTTSASGLNTNTKTFILSQKPINVSKSFETTTENK